MHSAHNSNTFLAYYNHIDKYFAYLLELKKYMPYTEKVDVIAKGGLSISRFVDQYQQKLRFFGQLRNQLVHGFRLENKHYVLASDHAVGQIKRLYQEMKEPTTVFDIFGKEVFTCQLDDDLKYVVDKMKQHLTTHVPVYDQDGQFVEMLSESTIAYRIAEQIDTHGKVHLEHTKVRDIPLKNANDFFVFAKKDTNIYALEDLFSENFKQHKRLGAVFITEDGTPQTPIEGVLTAMDLPELADHFVL